ncbi:histidine phosphatase family protein [Aureimonas leprariae]|uniref:Histidine phosphatase family protein n=1 Tax=Plantimonas leprariae TaxID=2615207 RepID=A0A7V7PP20_9HYPH|nr:histidine phosphatase family protein [Aureimonas leprariae]KAB0679592.1 histidine phosphatase family protein [Aureimonas leprariae]
MLPHLVLCRHGETDWNAERRIQGQTDVPMNRRGLDQAERNGETLRGLVGAGAPGWDFLASPMTRTRDTMAILRRALDLPADDYATDPRLMELNFGDWQGSTLAEIDVIQPNAVATRDRAKWSYVPSGEAGESYAMLEERMAAVFEALRRPTIVVAHGGIMRCFLRRYGGMDADAAAHVAIRQDRILEYRDGEIAWR